MLAARNDLGGGGGRGVRAPPCPIDPSDRVCCTSWAALPRSHRRCARTHVRPLFVPPISLRHRLRGRSILADFARFSSGFVSFADHYRAPPDPVESARRQRPGAGRSVSRSTVYKTCPSGKSAAFFSTAATGKEQMRDTGTRGPPASRYRVSSIYLGPVAAPPVGRRYRKTASGTRVRNALWRNTRVATARQRVFHRSKIYRSPHVPCVRRYIT